MNALIILNKRGHVPYLNVHWMLSNHNISDFYSNGFDNRGNKIYCVFSQNLLHLYIPVKRKSLLINKCWMHSVLNNYCQKEFTVSFKSLLSYIIISALNNTLCMINTQLSSSVTVIIICVVILELCRWWKPNGSDSMYLLF